MYFVDTFGDFSHTVGIFYINYYVDKINLIISNNKCLIILLFPFQLFKDVRIFSKEKKNWNLSSFI